MTAIHEAAASGNLTGLAAALAAGDDPNAPDASGRTPLYRAAELGRLEVVRRLLEAPGVDVDARSARGWTALIAASFAGRTSTVRALLADDRVRVNALDGEGRSALWWAATGGHRATAQAVARHGGDLGALDDSGTDPAGAAEAAGHPDLAMALQHLADELPAAAPRDPADRFVPAPLTGTGRVIREPREKLHGGR